MIRKIHEENHLADRDAVGQKIRRSLAVMHEKRNNRFDAFTYCGKRSPDGCLLGYKYAWAAAESARKEAEAVREAEEAVAAAKVGADVEEECRRAIKRENDIEDDYRALDTSLEGKIRVLMKDGDTLDAAKTVLGANYAELCTLAGTLKAFLDDSDDQEASINRWKEVEKFLQGIIDTETLTGLLDGVGAETD